MIEISIFDVDRTLTRRPTYSLFLLFAMRATAPWRVLLLPLIIPAAVAYALGSISRAKLKETMHRVAVGSYLPSGKAAQVAGRFADSLRREGIYPQALEQIDAERAAGRRVMLASAAPLLYIRPLAEALGVGHVVATASIFDGDRLTHRIDGGNCYGPEKLNMILQAFAQERLDREVVHVRFFTDHASDVAVCEWADEVVAVNPSPKMRALAAARGWPIVDWRAS